MAKALYNDHFGLREAPFSIAPDPQYLYLSDQHREALAHLLYGVGETGGFVLLTGEVGTGKTTVCRCLLQQLPAEVDLAFVFNPRQNAEELLHSICQEFHIDCEAGQGGKYYTDLLTRWLLAGHAQGRRAILLIDEAQNLSTDVLEQVRLLTNLETDDHKLLRLILLGQPELRDKLAETELRQLAQRITAHFHLEPLSASGTAEYVNHRLAVAGRVQEVFPDWSLRAIHRASGGVPRLINVLCDRVLLGLYGENRFAPSRGHLRRAAAEIRIPVSRPASRWRGGRVLSLTLLLVLLGGLLLMNSSPWQQGVAELVQGAPTIAVEKPAAVVLDIDSFANDYTGAVNELLQYYGQTEEFRTEDPCADITGRQFHCWRKQASMPELLALNRPAVIALAGSSGVNYVVLHSRQGALLQLAGNGHSGELTEAELAGLWQNDVTILTSFPGDATTLIAGQGVREEQLRWLNENMDRYFKTPDSSVHLRVDLQLDEDALLVDDVLDPAGFLLAHLAVVTVDDQRAQFSPALQTRLRRLRQELSLGDNSLLDAQVIMRLEAAVNPELPMLDRQQQRS